MSTTHSKSRSLLCLSAALIAVAVWLLPFEDSFAAKPGTETAGNNLSFPVIWAEDIPKTPPGTPGMTPTLAGEWWYWWGTAGDGTPLSEPPDPDDPNYLDDGIPNSVDSALVPPQGSVRAYVQKDPLNVWQAGSLNGSSMGTQPVQVDWIDWGDNLESVDWYTKSKVRTEVVLYKDLSEPMLEYGMRHVSGWGIDEVHGLAATKAGSEIIPEIGPGTQATVYSPLARLTIQKLHVESLDDIGEESLAWNPLQGWADVQSPDIADLINEDPIYNMAVYEGGDGPSYYSAEINVKGKVIYGYTWDVKRLNEFTEHGGEAAGYYRITFSLDDLEGPPAPALLNTSFELAQILEPVEEEFVFFNPDDGLLLAAEEGDTTGGATPLIDYENNLTYIDVLILEKIRGGNNGGGKGRGNGGGPGGGSLTGTIPEPVALALALALIGPAVALKRLRVRPNGG